MRIVTVVLACSLGSLAATAANAAAPNSIASVLGSSVGYLMAQSDLCDWGLGDKIEKTYQASFKAIGMTDAQQTSAWEQAKTTMARMGGMPAAGKARMKKDTCTPAARTRVEGYLAD